jgi:hypothetical protein
MYKLIAVAALIVGAFLVHANGQASATTIIQPGGLYENSPAPCPGSNR